MAKSGKTYTFARPAPAPRSTSGRLGTSREVNKASGSRKTYTFADPTKVVRRYEDEHSTVGPFGTEQTGWHYDGEEKTGPRWTCDYGCKSHVWIKGPAPWSFHDVDCPYWQREGRAGAPLLRSGTREPLNRPWRCAYGCTPFVWTEAPYPGQYHRWNCEWWSHEGAAATPFDHVPADA